MSWMLDDDTARDELRKKLKETESQVLSLENERFKQDQEFQELKRARDELLLRSQQEADRCSDIERQLKKKSEDLQQEILKRQNVESVLNAANETARRSDNSSRNLQRELDHFTEEFSHDPAAYDKALADRSVLEARVRELEQSLRDAQAPGLSPTLTRTRRGHHETPTAQVLDYENRILALQVENTRLVSLAPHTPRRPAAHAARRRSSSLSTPSSHPRVSTSTLEVASIRTQLEQEEAKAARLAEDLMRAENEILAGRKREERAKEDGMEWKDEACELRREVEELAHFKDGALEWEHKAHALENERLQESERADRAEKDLHSARAELALRQAEVVRLESQLSAQAPSSSSREDDTLPSNDELRSLSRDVEALQHEIRSKEEDLSTKTDEIAKLKDEIARLSSSTPAQDPNEVAELHASLTASQQECATLMGRIQDLEGEVRNGHAVEQLEEERDASIEAVETEREEGRTIRSQLSALQEEIQASAEKLDESHRRLDEANQELLDCHQQIADISAQLQQSQEDHRVAEQRSVDQAERLSELETRKDSADSTVLEVKEQRASEELEEYRRRVQALEAQLDLRDVKLREHIALREERQRAEDNRRRIILEADEIWQQILSKEEELLGQLGDAKARIALLEEQLLQSGRSDKPVQLGRPTALKMVEADPALIPLPSSPSSSDAPLPEDFEHVARLLAAVERLRSERDDLRRSLSFAHKEHAFAVADLQSKLELANQRLVVDGTANLNELPEGLAGTDRGTGSSDQPGEAQGSIQPLERPTTTGGLLSLEHPGGRATAAEAEVLLSQTRLFDATLDRDRLGRELEKAQAELDSALEVVEQTRRELAEASNQRSTLQFELQQLKYSMVKVREELDASQSTVASLRHDQALAAVSPDDAMSALRTQRDELEERVVRRNHTIAYHMRDIQRLETNLKVASEAINDLQFELQACMAERDSVTERCTVAEEERYAAVRAAAELETEREGLRASILRSEQDAQLSRRAGEEAATEELAATVSAFIDSVQRRRTVLATLRGVAARLSTAEELASTKTNEVHSLSAELQTASSERQAALDKLHGVQEQYASAKEAIEKTSNDVRRLSDELERARAEVEILSERMAASRTSSESRVEESQAKVTQLTATVTELEAQLQAAQQSLEATVGARDEATLAEQRMRNDLDLLQSSLETAEQDLARATEQANLVSVLQASLEEREKELNNVRVAHSKELAEALSQAAVQQQALEQTILDLKASGSSLESKNQELEVFAEKAREFDCLNQQLKITLEAHAEESKSLRDELRASAEQGVFHLRRIDDLQEQLRTQATVAEEDRERHQVTLHESQKFRAKSALREQELIAQTSAAETKAAAKERLAVTLDLDLANLQVDLRKAIAARTHLTGQLDTSTHEIASLKIEITQLRDQLIEAQGTISQSEQRLSELERRATSSDLVDDLKQQIGGLEQQLRQKAAETEEADDKMLAMVKEKKKLSGKVETLSKRVQSLQTKLQSTKTPQTPGPASTAAPDVSSVSSAVTHSAPAVPLPTPAATAAAPPSRSIARTPSISTNIFGGPALAQPTAPALRPSAAQQAIISPVAPLRIPSKINHPSPMAGKKRSLPEEFSSYDPAPMQVVVAECPAVHRIRKPGGTGFTPVRSASRNHTQNSPRPILTPRRLNISKLGGSITDITNSPRPPIPASMPLSKAPALSNGRMMSSASQVLFNQISQSLQDRHV